LRWIGEGSVYPSLLRQSKRMTVQRDGKVRDIVLRTDKTAASQRVARYARVTKGHEGDDGRVISVSLPRGQIQEIKRMLLVHLTHGLFLT
jgi:hypothetical protein